MDNSKNLLQSKGVWGGLIAFVAGLAEIAEQQGADIPILGDYAPLVTVAGSILALFGRVFASTTIKF